MIREELLSMKPVVERTPDNSKFKINRAYKNTLDKFWSLVDKHGTDDCWLWRGGKSKEGYGRYHLNGINIHAHRLSYLLEYGSIVDELTIDHLCRNPSCVNPEHLELVTNKENIMRGVGITALNVLKLSCPKGHPYSGNNLYLFPKKTKDGSIKYWRKCRECHRVNQANFMARKG